MAATITTTELKLKTYPFSDPDPVPCTGETRYPYCFFDGTTDKGVTQKWNAVVLESDRLKVTVIPALGGKIWAAVHKPSGRDILYCNHSVKFRNIAMRGPWCSGGIEFNFGIIGHSPSTTFPVNWQAASKAGGDGTVTCFVGDTEAICRTTWQVRIELKDGDDFFTTCVYWFNGSGQPVPYYQWMNGAFPARKDTEFVYPGANWIDHDGTAHPWPIDAEGRDWSRYSNLAFGGAKSCHVLNGDHGVFGVWWPEANFGSFHRSAVTEKYGRKIFLWALSRAGELWKDLLTDGDGQYVELQSGRCFNQPVDASYRTPFKHPSFAPGMSEVFEERWGAVTNRNDFDRFVEADGKYAPRPLAMPKDFDWNSVYGLYLAGVQQLNQKHDREGRTKLEACLGKDPNYAPAHDELALLATRRGLWSEAHRHAEAALAIDTYDAAANYADALAFIGEGKLSEAAERLGLAAFSPTYRAAAYTALAKVELRRNRLAEAWRATEKALKANAGELDALQMQIVLMRKEGNGSAARSMATSLLRDLPLAYAANYELDLQERGKSGCDQLIAQTENPVRRYADLGEWYDAIGCREDAIVHFAKAAGSDPVAAARLAELKGGDRSILEAAAKLPAAGVFPFRVEDLAALARAAEAGVSWKFAYYRAVLLAALGRDEESHKTLEDLGNTPDEAVFYLYRARERGASPDRRKSALEDLALAERYGDTWRVGIARMKIHEKNGDWKAALEAVQPYVKDAATAEPIKVAYATALAKCGRFDEAYAYLKRITVLPSEFGFNASEAWILSCRGRAEAALGKGDEKTALEAAADAVSYPENLGVGRPFEIDLERKPFDTWTGDLKPLLRRALKP